MPDDIAPEQHGSDKECDKVPNDNSNNVNNDPLNANTNHCETASESDSPPEAVQNSSSSNCFSSSSLRHQ